MKWKLLLFSLSFILFHVSVNAQETWSLEQCINHAQKNSLNVKQAELAIKSAQLNERRLRFSRYPDLRANVGGNLNFGLALDPTSNTLKNETSGNASFGVSTGVNVYQGGFIHHSIKQAEVDIKAAEADVDQSSTNIALDVALAYLNILFAEEQLSAAQQRLGQTQAQLTQTDKLIQAGTLPQNDRLEILARIATDEQAIVTQQNAVTINYLTLKQLLTLDPSYDLRIQKPQIEVPSAINPESFEFEQIYMQALQTQPQIEAGELRLKSAEMQVDIAKSGLYPTIGFGANINSRYASGVLDPDKADLTNARVIQTDPEDVEINGEPATLSGFRTVGVEFGKRAFGDQLKDFLGQSIGVNVSIPIYNNHRTRINMENAQVGILNQQVQNEQIKQQLKANVQRSIADAVAAKKTLEAAQKTVESLRVAYDNTNKRYQLGAVNTFELTTAKTNVDNAEIDLIIAKYDYLYKLKIVDFYQGNKITLQ